MVYRLHLQHARRIRTELQVRPDPARKLAANIYEFYSKNKFEKLVHLVGFLLLEFIKMHDHLKVQYENSGMKV